MRYIQLSLSFLRATAGGCGLFKWRGRALAIKRAELCYRGFLEERQSSHSG